MKKTIFILMTLLFCLSLPFEYTHPYSNGMLNEDQEEEEEL